MQFGEVSHDGEAESGPGRGFVGADTTLQNFLAQCDGKAWTVVVDHDGDSVSILG